LIVLDNFLQDKKILEEIQKDETWKDFPAYNWWDGWWKSKPRNIMEILIEIIWKRLSVENKFAGFEYWSNSQTKNQSLDWHLDKDEKLNSVESKIISPSIGHIFYSKVENLEGGFLELSSNRKINDTSNIERIKPTENRLIIFNPSLPHRVTKIFKGNRRAFLANAWVKKPLTFELSDQVDKNFQPYS
tara:strand:- start:174 stop:737 length:564 start_codon:yes stop_codon:yes gene_type:complete